MEDDARLDGLLSQAAPRNVACVDPIVLRRLVVETEERSHRRPGKLFGVRTRAMALASVAILGVGGAAAGAAATVGVEAPSWVPWVGVDTGGDIDCEVSFGVVAWRYGSPNADAEMQRRTLREARAILAGLDYDALALDGARTDSGGSAVAQARRREATMSSAVNAVVSSELTERGLDPASIAVSSATRCGR